MTLIKYIFVPGKTTSLLASGEMWTNSSFNTIGPNSFFLLKDDTGAQPAWRVELHPESFLISQPASQSLTPFVLGGTAVGNGVVQLIPGAVQGWNFRPSNDPGPKLPAASGDGVWKLA